MLAGDLGQRRVLRHRAIRKGIEPAPNARKPPLAHQASQRDPGQTAGVQIQGTDESLVTGKRKDGILGRFHAGRLFR
jgi:hypothetical protein